jgi:hypothetical protein
MYAFCRARPTHRLHTAHFPIQCFSSSQNSKDKKDAHISSDASARSITGNRIFAAVNYRLRNYLLCSQAIIYSVYAILQYLFYENGMV